MKLLRYRVENFRSVSDSGWIQCDDLTTLVGVNEAGKSNLLLALWKFNPAEGGEINLLADLPRSRYSEVRDNVQRLFFVHAEFELTDAMVQNIVRLTCAEPDDVKIARVSRDFRGNYYVSFPNGKTPTTVPSAQLSSLLDSFSKTIYGMEESSGVRATALEYIGTLRGAILDRPSLESADLTIFGTIIQQKPAVLDVEPIKSKMDQLHNELARLRGIFRHPNQVPEARAIVRRGLPAFVYYSNYGNIDSEIYLPHVVENLQRTDLTGAAEAKVRTLRVLFEYVGLNPQEILDLGAEAEPIVNPQNNQIVPPTEEQIASTAKKKAERDVLLQSASTNLTAQFRSWWKQGEQTFDFRADGKHFRIWVSDDLRPAKVELESRSTGLQWFFSFFLVFLVESKVAHKGSILLLDEAGLSLHPLAQRDLLKFFENLSTSNQIIHTTHSPFLVDTNHVDRVKVVYVDENGQTVASDNFGAGLPKRHEGSIYAIQAALGLSISDVLLQGSQPVIVKEPSDQIYLNVMKTYLISQQLIAPKEELLFLPSGSAKGIETIAAISGKDETLPVVIVDSDSTGQDFKNKLLLRLYRDIPYRVIEIAAIRDMENAAIEDLVPLNLLTNALNKLFRDVDEEVFVDSYRSDKPIIPQIEAFAAKHGITLEQGWKVGLARHAKQRLLRHPAIAKDIVYRWVELFNRFI